MENARFLVKPRPSDQVLLTAVWLAWPGSGSGASGPGGGLGLGLGGLGGLVWAVWVVWAVWAADLGGLRTSPTGAWAV